MKYFAIILTLVIFSGCTSLKPIDLPPEQLQDRIVTEEIIKVGQSVKIATSDGKTHEFEVTEIRDDHILGKDVDIPVKDIVALENREVSTGKTLAFAGGTAVGFIVVISILLIAAAPAMML
jgi:hypothetical protein